MTTILFLLAGFHGFGNSPLSKPFMKVCYGKQRFEEIVSKFGTTDKKVELETSLLELMGNNKDL